MAAGDVKFSRLRRVLSNITRPSIVGHSWGRFVQPTAWPDLIRWIGYFIENDPLV